MALSCYANGEELEPHLSPEFSIFAQPQMPELPPPELHGFDSNYAIQDSWFDPFLESHHELFCSNNYHSLLPFVSSSPTENLYSQVLAPKIFPAYDQYEPYHYLKHQKMYEGSFSTEIIPPAAGLCNCFAVDPRPSLFQQPSPEILHFPDFVSNSPACGTIKSTQPPKRPGTSGSLSAQSIAARQRRRKITEKTQELGKLIPGAQKMNTAEMFHAAFKYIKFLQAQVRILETLASIHQENGDSFDNEEMGRLLGSSLVQEKLYIAEKCLVPKKSVESLANHHELQLDNGRSSSDIKRLL